jgi:hypothetical protein
VLLSFLDFAEPRAITKFSCPKLSENWQAAGADPDRWLRRFADVLAKQTPELLSGGTDWITALKGKEVFKTGKIALYKGKLEIVLTAKENAKLLMTRQTREERAVLTAERAT